MHRTFNNINVIWVFFGGLILILTVINGTYTDYDSVGLLAVSLHAIVTIVFLRMLPVKGSKILVWAFVARFAFMLWDLYARDIFVLPSSGADSEMYYKASIMVSDDLSFLFKSRVSLYSKIIGFVFYLIGPMRIVGHYINVLLGLSTVVIIYKIMLELKINRKTIKTVLIIAAFFPNSLIMSGIFLREILPTFFVALSLLWFIKWYLNQSLLSFVLSIVMLSLASMFHSGVIGIAIGYLLMYLFYNYKKNKFEVSFKNIIMFIPVLAFIFLFTTQFGDAMFYKFRSLEEPSDIYESVQGALGGAAYLTGMTINNPLQFLLFAPVRAFYFLFSPLPMNWRGVMDIITFFIDSIFYLFVFYYFIKNRKMFYKNKKLIFVLLISVTIAAIVYGIGVSNAGTAMRHRQKLTPLFLILTSLMINEKERNFHRLKNK